MKARKSTDARKRTATSAGAAQSVWFEVPSEFGPWRGVVTARGLARLTTADLFGPPPADAKRDDRHAAAVEVREYLAGRRREFSVPVDLSAEPPFRRRVLELLTSRVGYGETTSYRGLATLAGKPKAARAVGQAVGKNPVPLVVPCHRVLETNGGLGGFGFGLPMKRALLAMEQTSAAGRRGD